MVKLGRELITEEYGFSIGDLDYYSVRNSCILFGELNYYNEEDIDSILLFIEYNPDVVLFSYNVDLIKLFSDYGIEIEYCERQISNYNNSDFVDNIGRSIDKIILLPRYIRRENLSKELLENYRIIHLGEF